MNTTSNFDKISNQALLQSTRKLRPEVICSNNKSSDNNDYHQMRNINSKSKRNSSSSTVDDMTDMDNMFTKFAFPFKLHSILENAEKFNKEEIISWLTSGKSFKIHKPKEFADSVMPQYFNQTKYRSFQRQLYIYGFDRIKDKSSDEYGAYYHELFVRGVSDLCLDMTRKKVKGTGLSNEERRRNKVALSSIHKGSKKKKPTAKSTSSQKQKRPSSSSSSTMNPSLELQTSTNQQVHQQQVRRVSEWNNEQELLLSSVSIKRLQQQQSLLQQQQRTVLRRVSEWNNDIPTVDAIDSARGIISRQQQQQQQQNVGQKTSTLHQCLSGEFGINMNMMGGRRCSLGFIRSAERRGSLKLYDGDEVCFNNKKFFFTTQY